MSMAAMHVCRDIATLLLFICIHTDVTDSSVWMKKANSNRGMSWWAYIVPMKSPAFVDATDPSFVNMHTNPDAWLLLYIATFEAVHCTHVWQLFAFRRQLKSSTLQTWVYLPYPHENKCCPSNKAILLLAIFSILDWLTDECSPCLLVYDSCLLSGGRWCLQHCKHECTC